MEDHHKSFGVFQQSNAEKNHMYLFLGNKEGDIWSTIKKKKVSNLFVSLISMIEMM